MAKLQNTKNKELTKQSEVMTDHLKGRTIKLAATVNSTKEKEQIESENVRW